MGTSSRVDEELNKPLLETETVTSSVYSDHNPITSKATKAQLLAAGAVATCVTAGAVSSIVSFLMYPIAIVYIAGGVCLFNCPIVLYKQKKLMALKALRDIVNGLRHQIELLDKAIEDTQKEIDDLKIISTRFGGVEDELEEVAKIQGMSAQRIVELVKENEEILVLMKENLRQRIIQDVIGTVVRSDRNGDLKFDRVEAKFLALKIKVKLEVYGIYFDEEKFLQAIALRPSFAGAIAVIKKLLPVEYQNENEMDDTRTRSSSSSRFDDDDSLDEDDLYDMFYMTRDEQGQRESVMAVRAVFGAAPERRISLASPSLERRHDSFARSSRFTSSYSDDVIHGGGNMFPVIKE